MDKFDHKAIEDKWKNKWFAHNLYKAVDFSPKPKKYILAELPYPSGKCLHVGHMMRYTVPEIYARYLRMKGYNVLFPMGWDCFGLPAETYALKEKMTPQQAIAQATKDYKEAMKNMGYSIDWDREINTSDPEYSKWTQWLFLKLYEKNLVEIKEMPVWWCKELGVLADEEVLPGKDGGKISERGGHPVQRKIFRQWVLKITAYADKLLEGLDRTEYTDSVKQGQINWIGRKEGALVKFQIKGSPENLEAFTTRPDTIYGVTFLALSPEHPLINKLIANSPNKSDISQYIEDALAMSDLDRQTKDKTGVLIKGGNAIHPFTGEDLPIYVADYILAEYGTGVVMGVPAHDTRDYEFAAKYNIGIKQVVRPITRPVAIFIHGWGSTKDTGFFPELEKELKSRGYITINDTYKNSDNPNYQEWLKILSESVKKYADHPITLIGHSAGGYLALKLAELFPVNKLFIVAPCGSTSTYNANRLQAIREWLQEEQVINNYLDFHKSEINEKLVTASHPLISIVFGANDPYILEPEQSYYKNKFGAENCIFLNGYSHMGSQDGSKAALDLINKFGYNIVEEDGLITNSGIDNEGVSTQEFKRTILQKLEKENKGGKYVTYKLRDQIWARQRYWGDPIPLKYKADGTVEEETQLPVVLPELTKEIMEGKSDFPPLSEFPQWLKTTDSQNQPATREADTMPTWAGSNWYYIRYLDPNNSEKFADFEKMKYWLPVDKYYGDPGHTTAHLLYTRFWYKVLFEDGLVPNDEPFLFRMSGGILLGKDKRKMSKSRPDYVVDPQYVLDNFGADSVRTFLAFLGPYSETFPWNDEGMKAMYKFIQGIYNLKDKVKPNCATPQLTRALHIMIKNVGEMCEDFKMNTAVPQIMIFVNMLKEVPQIDLAIWKEFLKVLAPFAPFITEELWQEANAFDKWTEEHSIHLQAWPEYDKEVIKDEIIKIPVMINGKVRTILEVEPEISETSIIQMALDNPNVKKYTTDKTLNTLYAKGKAVSISF